MTRLLHSSGLNDFTWWESNQISLSSKLRKEAIPCRISLPLNEDKSPREHRKRGARASGASATIMGQCATRSAAVAPIDEVKIVQQSISTRRRQKKPHSESFTTESTDTSADAFDPVNESIIRRLKNNDPSFTLLTVSSEDTDHLFLNSFCARCSRDLQLVGDVVSSNTYLTELHVIMLDNMQLETDRFYKGLSKNKTLKSIRLSCTDVLEGLVFGMLAPFFKGNPHLALVVVDGCNISPIGKRMLSLALEGNTNPRLKVLIENGLNQNSSVSKEAQHLPVKTEDLPVKRETQKMRRSKSRRTSDSNSKMNECKSQRMKLSKSNSAPVHSDMNTTGKASRSNLVHCC